MAKYVDVILRQYNFGDADEIFVEIEDPEGKSVGSFEMFVDEKGFRHIRITPWKIRKA